MGVIDFLCILIIIFIIVPICTLLHEFGHAIPLLLFTKNEVTVTLGKKPALIQFSTQRLKMNFHILYSSGGRVDSNGVVTDKRIRFLIYAGGPIVSLFIAFFSFMIIFNYSLDYITFILVRGAGIYASLQVIITSIPMHYPNWFGENFAKMPSDGMNILNLFRRSSELEN